MSYAQIKGCDRFVFPPTMRSTRLRRRGGSVAIAAARFRLRRQSQEVACMIATASAPTRAPAPALDPDRWRDKRGFAEHLSCGIRWIEERMAEGMPYAYIAGRAKFKVPKAESWLYEHGFIEWRGGDAA